MPCSAGYLTNNCGDSRSMLRHSFVCEINLQTGGVDKGTGAGFEPGPTYRQLHTLPNMLCSNSAATRVTVLKNRERLRRDNVPICRCFTIFRNLQQSIALPSHGRGRWFEPSIAHSKGSANGRKEVASGFRIGGFYCNRTATEL